MANDIKAPVQNKEVDAEIAAQDESMSGFFKTSGAIGPLGLEKRAIQLGESTNKSGRPSIGAYLALTTAIVCSKPSFAVQNTLANIANKHVNPEFVNAKGERVQVAKMKAKGEHGGASCSYRFNKPVAWDLAVG
jgi:hypothetical protein